MTNKKSPLFWNLMEEHPFLTVLFILTIQSIFTMDYRSLWFSDEVRYADVYTQMKDAGHWLVLYLNGVAYPDKPPVYFWLLSFLDKFTPADGVQVFFLGSTVSAAIYLVSSIAFAKVLGCTKRTTIGTGLILLSSIFFIGIAHYSRMDLLFASFIIWANICLYKGFHSRRSSSWIVASFFFMGIATLTKGPLGIVFPALTALCYLAYKKRLSLLKDNSFKKGLLVLLGILIAWIVGAILVDGTAFIENIFYKQIYQRAVSSFHHEEPFQYYFIAFPLAWMPLTMAFFGLPFEKILSLKFWRLFVESRSDSSNDGRDWAWIMLVSGFIMLTCLSIKVLIYILPLFAPLALLTAKGLLEENENGHTFLKSNRIYFCVACFYALVALAAPFAELLLPFEIKGLSFTVLILGLGSLMLLKSRACNPKKGLVIMVTAMTIWMQPLAIETLPSLDSVMSPRMTGELMNKYFKQGYYPLAHKIYSGIFTYYAGTNIHETSDMDEISNILKSKDKVVMVMQKKYYTKWENKPDNIRIINEQFISDRPYLLILKD